MAETAAAPKNVKFIITRQDDPQSSSYVEEFELPYRPGMNVISALMEIQRNPVNAKGDSTVPVCWDSNCLEQPVRIEPMKTFPVVRDLVIDRTRMFNALKRVKAWIPIDGTYDLGPGPRMPEKKRQWAYELSKCMTCGVCLEACPNVNEKTDFIGPAAISQVRLFNAHPTGEMNADERLDALMEDGGIAGCGNSQNCVRACPKGIPLTTSIAEINKQTTKHMFKRWLGV